MTIRCKNCGCTKIHLNQVGAHLGAYCDNCDKWIKWLNQNEFMNMSNKVSAFDISTKSAKKNSVTAPATISVHKLKQLCGEYCEHCRLFNARTNKCMVDECK